MQKNKKNNSYIPKDIPVFVNNFPKKIDKDLYLVFLDKYIKNKYKFYFLKKVNSSFHHQFDEIADEIVYDLIIQDKTYESIIHFLNYSFTVFRNRGFAILNKKNIIIAIDDYDSYIHFFDDVIYDFDPLYDKKEYINYNDEDLKKVLYYIKSNFNEIEYCLFVDLFIKKPKNSIIMKKYKINIIALKQTKNKFINCLVNNKEYILENEKK